MEAQPDLDRRQRRDRQRDEAAIQSARITRHNSYSRTRRRRIQQGSRAIGENRGLNQPGNLRRLVFPARILGVVRVIEDAVLPHVQHPGRRAIRRDVVPARECAVVQRCNGERNYFRLLRLLEPDDHIGIPLSLLGQIPVRQYREAESGVLRKETSKEGGDAVSKHAIIGPDLHFTLCLRLVSLERVLQRLTCTHHGGDMIERFSARFCQLNTGRRPLQKARAKS